MFNVVNGIEVTTEKANSDYIRKLSRECSAAMSVISNTPSTPRSVRQYHRGNGTLRGGGVQKIYNTRPSLKAYRHKLDRRLGVCIYGCLVTIATILIIYGLFHEAAHQQLTTYIAATKQIIIESLPLISTSTETITDGIVVEKMLLMDNDSNSYLTSPLTEPDTCLGSVDVDRQKCLTVNELQSDYDSLHATHIVLWNLVALNVIIAVLLMPLICIFCNEKMRNNRNYKLLYRVSLFLALFFMAIQLIFLISPLLRSAYNYPLLVDKLFVYKLPRDQNLINMVQSQFGCQFDYVPQLVELNLQEPCLPTIKNSLIPTYTVILLIILDLLPFAFIIFTYAWDAYIKDTPLCSGARRRIELNNQQRPQSREDILKRTMEEPQYV